MNKFKFSVIHIKLIISNYYYI